MIFRMGFEMLCQVGNFFTQDGNLNFWRPRICRVHAIRIHDFCLLFYCK